MCLVNCFCFFGMNSRNCYSEKYGRRKLMSLCILLPTLCRWNVRGGPPSSEKASLSLLLGMISCVVVFRCRSHVCIRGIVWASLRHVVQVIDFFNLSVQQEYIPTPDHFNSSHSNYMLKDELRGKKSFHLSSSK
jgi:hypothetical protein